MSDHEIERVLVYYNLTPAQTYQEREFASQRLKIAISALEELKELNCACGNHYIGGNLESYLCIQCKALEQIKKGL